MPIQFQEYSCHSKSLKSCSCATQTTRFSTSSSTTLLLPLAAKPLWLLIWVKNTLRRQTGPSPIEKYLKVIKGIYFELILLSVTCALRWNLKLLWASWLEKRLTAHWERFSLYSLTSFSDPATVRTQVFPKMMSQLFLNFHLKLSPPRDNCMRDWRWNQ